MVSSALWIKEGVDFSNAQSEYDNASTFDDVCEKREKALHELDEYRTAKNLSIAFASVTAIIILPKVIKAFSDRKDASSGYNSDHASVSIMPQFGNKKIGIQVLLRIN